MRPYAETRDSGVEWLGAVPGHWDVVPLKRTCDVFPSNVDKHTKPGEVPVTLCNYTDVYHNERVTPDMSFMDATATEAEVEKFAVRAGDTVFTKDSETADDIGIAAYVENDIPGTLYGYHLSIARPRDGTHGAFVKRWFDGEFAKAYFETRANGLTRVGLGQQTLDNLPIALPPLPEQRAIATFLDRETGRIDALIEEQERMIALLKERRAALVSAAVTGKIDVRDAVLEEEAT